MKDMFVMTITYEDMLRLLNAGKKELNLLGEFIEKDNQICNFRLVGQERDRVELTFTGTKDD